MTTPVHVCWMERITSWYCLALSLVSGTVLSGPWMLGAWVFLERVLSQSEAPFLIPRWPEGMVKPCLPGWWRKEEVSYYGMSGKRFMSSGLVSVPCIIKAVFCRLLDALSSLTGVIDSAFPFAFGIQGK